MRGRHREKRQNGTAFWATSSSVAPCGDGRPRPGGRLAGPPLGAGGAVRRWTVRTAYHRLYGHFPSGLFSHKRL
eukprot:6719642-Prymnesium_polylepis.1